MAENRIAVDRTVGEGDVIAVEDMHWTVLETPGHSDCSISLHEPARRVLVISDASGYLHAEPRNLVAGLLHRLRRSTSARWSGWPHWTPRCSA